jgi:hypothetical protein
MVSLKGRKVYLDSSAVIYAMEGLSTYSNLKVGLLIPLDNLEFVEPSLSRDPPEKPHLSAVLLRKTQPENT